ncbi:MAG: PilN domain-containing protein [Synergistetes bacterium]|nr:PilN domain-containing protein [Synergistota bacterium]
MKEFLKFKPNLLPKEVKNLRRKKLFFSLMRISLVLAWVMSVFFALWLYYQYNYFSELVKDKEKTFNALVSQLQRENPLNAYKEAESFVKQLKSFTSELLPIYEFLLSLSSNFPDGVKLDKIESFKERELRIYGLASSPKAIAELLNVIKNMKIIQEVSLPSFEGEKGGELPFNFICKLKSWW